MFTSFSSNIEKIVKAVIDNVPAKDINILDVGGAFGKYALLIKEGIASLRSEAGDLCPDISDVKIDNLDIADYFKQIPWLKGLYENIMYLDIRGNEKICDKYNMVLMIDVVEHMDKEEFHDMIQRIKVPVLISTPKETVMYEHEHYGFAKHCSQYEPSDFTRYNAIDFSTPDSHIYLIKAR